MKAVVLALELLAQMIGQGLEEPPKAEIALPPLPAQHSHRPRGVDLFKHLVRAA